MAISYRSAGVSTLAPLQSLLSPCAVKWPKQHEQAVRVLSVCCIGSMLIDIQTTKSLPMQEESQASQKIQSTSLLTHMSSVVGSSIPATWAQRIHQRKLGSERKTFQTRLEGKHTNRTGLARLICSLATIPISTWTLSFQPSEISFALLPTLSRSTRCTVEVKQRIWPYRTFRYVSASRSRGRYSGCMDL